VSSAADGGAGPLDLRTIRTSNLTLLIGGGSLPTLKMVDIQGVMRIQEFQNGEVELRFDEYGGVFVEGLPTGQLNFRDVKGYVQTGANRLLRFEGGGESEGEPVTYKLDIFTEPHRLVKIDARFPKLSMESLSTLAFSGYTKFTKNLDVTVRHGQ
jgi:hypothetical protein